MLIVLLTLSAAVIWSGCSCCTSQKTESDTTVRDDENGGNDRPGAGAPTAIVQNLTYIEALVESLLIIDDMDYRLSIRLISAKGGGSAGSLAEPGQQLTVVPRYLMIEEGTQEKESERNGRLMSLRSARNGDKFEGTISRSTKDGWILIDANYQK